jgi:hypothetical protein
LKYSSWICRKHEKIEKVTDSQDDDFVGVLKKNIQNKLALMGLRPILSAHPSMTSDFGWKTKFLASELMDLWFRAAPGFGHLSDSGVPREDQFAGAHGR